VYINPALKPKPAALLHGGGHERGLRSGTLNVPGIVGLGVASKLIQQRLAADDLHIRTMRDLFEKRIVTELECVYVNGNKSHRLPGVSNLLIKYTDSQAVMTKFRSKLAISSGSACSSADPAPSHVLRAMGLSEAEAKGSYRISMGRHTTPGETEAAANLLIEAVREYRAQSPLWEMHLKGIEAEHPDLK
jgi:cysteine desulfurase